MNLCSYGHDEICFEGRSCPFCDVIGEKDTEIRQLSSELESAKDEIRELEIRVSDLESD